MPDRNGFQTRRDQFPILCDRCKQVIRPPRYNTDGELIADAEPYRVTGMIPVFVKGNDEKPIPQNIYVHLSCVGVRKHRAKESIDIAPNVCPYCLVAVDKPGPCAICREQYRRDMAAYKPTEAVLELARALSQMRDDNNGKLPTVREYVKRDRDESPEGREEAPEPKPRISPKMTEAVNSVGAFVPTCEMGVVLMFGQIMSDLPYDVKYMDGWYPDAVLADKHGHTIRAEFEFVSSNFIAHKHDPSMCDLVICWANDRALPVPVMPIGRHYDPITGKWTHAGEWVQDAFVGPTEA